MAENRCPMCSKPNPEGAEECEFCGARLTPLSIDPSGQTGEGMAPGEGGESGGPDEVPDWLARIRRREDEEVPDEEQPGEAPDWLSRLRTTSAEEKGPPPGEVPDWVSEGESEEPAAEDDWLDRLRETTGAAEEGPGPSEEIPPDSGEVPVGDEAADETEEPPGFAAEAEAPGAASEAEEEPPEEAGTPDWLGEAAEEPDADTPSEPEDETEFTSEEEPAGRPEWFDEFEQAADAEVASPEPTRAEPPLPDWLGDDEPEAEEEPTVEEPAFSAEADLGEMADEVEGEDLDWDSFDWDSLSEEQEAEPDLEGLGAPPEDEEEVELPHVPAIIMDEDDEEALAGPDEFDLDAIQLPDWLTDAEAAAPEEGTWEGGEDLAPATIPSWLESMRPVETFEPIVELEPEEEQSVESIGPLAGLRGVLLAEPVVAKPRTSTKVGTQLQVTERQYAQASLLNRIVEEEDQELIVSRAKRRPLPLIRWLISLALLTAMLLPPILGIPTFKAPARVSRNLAPLVEVVNSVPTERPALVVFDYEPGYSAELEGVAGALLENLMARNVRLVTVATRPTGPPLALDLIATIGAPHALDNGRNYVHLGYLSGGPAAIQLFSQEPREAILKGFMLPEDIEAQSAWDLPILRDVDALSDFGMVAVVASGTDNARMWAEQAAPLMGDTPLLMVLSTGAEPLIRPYFESLDPQVDGILTGLPAAVAYEERNGRKGAARARWDAYGAGMLAVEGVLLAGTFYGAVQWILTRREEEE